MKKTFTHEFMQQNKGCYTLEELNNCSFMKRKTITLSSILNSEIKLKDKYWFVCHKLLTKKQNQWLVISVAEIVLEIYEDKYTNKAPRAAIQAAKDYLNNKITLKILKQKINAAVAAADTYAAYAAADVADAAAIAAVAAVVTVAIVTYAAVYKTKNYQELLLVFLKDYCEKIK